MCWRCVEGLGGEGEKQTKKKGGREEKKKSTGKADICWPDRATAAGGVWSVAANAEVRPPGEEEAEKTLKEAQDWWGKGGGGKPHPHSPDRVTRGQGGVGGHDEKMPAGDAHSPSGIIPECF